MSDHIVLINEALYGPLCRDPKTYPVGTRARLLSLEEAAAVAKASVGPPFYKESTLAAFQDGNIRWLHPSLYRRISPLELLAETGEA